MLSTYGNLHVKKDYNFSAWKFLIAVRALADDLSYNYESQWHSVCNYQTFCSEEDTRALYFRISHEPWSHKWLNFRKEGPSRFFFFLCEHVFLILDVCKIGIFCTRFRRILRDKKINFACYHQLFRDCFPLKLKVNKFSFVGTNPRNRSPLKS